MRPSLFKTLLLVGLAAAPVHALAAAEVPDNLVLRLHFAGLNQVVADPKSAKLKQIANLPATVELQKHLRRRLAEVPFLAVSNLAPRGSGSQAGVFQPLLEDVPGSELFVDWRETPGKPAEFVLALRLADDRAAAWRTGLWQALDAWKLGRLAATAEGFSLVRADGRTGLVFSRVGLWVVLGVGAANSPLQAQTVARIKSTGRPAALITGNWLEADARLERLKPWLPPLAPYAHPPLARLSLATQEDNVRTTLSLLFSGGHGWKAEDWRTPKRLVRDPLISFMAARGIGPLLKAWPAFQTLKLNPTPDQVFVWAHSAIPFLTQMAVPMKNAGPELSRITPLLPAVLLSRDPARRMGTIAWDTNVNAVIWKGFPPLCLPMIEALKDGSEEYLVGGLYPRVNSTNRPPPEMFAQFEKRKDVVYYDWEITEGRLKQWRAIYQLTDLAAARNFPDPQSTPQQWVDAVTPLLGNSITEVTAASPTELRMTRKSHVGLTGFELMTVLRWLDAPDFPKFSTAGPARKPGRSAPPR